MIAKLCLLLAITACATSSAELSTHECVKAIWGGPTAKSNRYETGTKAISSQDTDLKVEVPYGRYGCKLVGVEVTACQQDLVELSFAEQSVVHIVRPLKRPTLLTFFVDCEPVVPA